MVRGKGVKYELLKIFSPLVILVSLCPECLTNCNAFILMIRVAQVSCYWLLVVEAVQKYFQLFSSSPSVLLGEVSCLRNLHCMAACKLFSFQLAANLQCKKALITT